MSMSDGFGHNSSDEEIAALRAEVERLRKQIDNQEATILVNDKRIDALLRALREIEGDCSDQWAVEVAAAAIKEAGE